MVKNMTRAEQRPEDTWAVEKMYASEELWEKDLKAFQAEMGRIADFSGKLTESPETLADAIDTKLTIERKLENLYVYSHLREDVDTTDAHYQDMEMRAVSMLQEYNALVSFFEPEILEIPAETMKSWLEENARLQEYKRFIEVILRQAPHTLPKEQEAILAKTAAMKSAPRNAYALLNNADMTFPSVEHNGETVELTNSNFVRLQESKDRELRRKVYENYYSSYRGHENTIASLFQSNIKGALFNSEVRNFSSNRAMYLFDSAVPEEIYDNLIDTVHSYLPAMHKYVGLRKKLLGIDDLHFYDVYASLVGNYEKEYSFAEAKEMVLEALKPLGEEYGEIVRSAFADRLMDIYPNKGKRSGAYSSGSYDSYPYMLLNFNGSLDSVFTLIHEMGHSVHSYLTHKNQPYCTGDYKIFVAEVASTCNEALLTHYLLQVTTDKEARKHILNHFMDSFKGTLYRQTMFAEFEKITHAKVEAGESLTAPVLKQIYRDLNAQYFGPEMEVDEEISLEWARIPHFYTPFYVYQYATGFSAAIALSRKILEEGAPAVQDYLKFLQSGSAQDPIDLLKLAGVDMSKKESVAKALDVFVQTIEDFEQLI